MCGEGCGSLKVFPRISGEADIDGYDERVVIGEAMTRNLGGDVDEAPTCLMGKIEWEIDDFWDEMGNFDVGPVWWWWVLISMEVENLNLSTYQCYKQWNNILAKFVDKNTKIYFLV